jgi:hypothetical protein
MPDFTNRELDLMSRALERALSSIEGKPRRDYTTGDLATGIFQAAAEGVRCEETLAKRAVEYARSSREEAQSISEGAAAEIRDDAERH